MKRRIRTAILAGMLTAPLLAVAAPAQAGDGCYTTSFGSRYIDDPYTEGIQRWGTVFLYRYTCGTVASTVWWASGSRVDSGPLVVGLVYIAASDGVKRAAWGSGSGWVSSPDVARAKIDGRSRWQEAKLTSGKSLTLYS